MATNRSSHGAIAQWLDRLSKEAHDRLSKHDISALDDEIWDAIDAEHEAINVALDKAEGPAVDEDAPIPDASERVRRLAKERDEWLEMAERTVLRERAALELLRRFLVAGGDHECRTRAGKCSTHNCCLPCIYGDARALVHAGVEPNTGSTTP